MNKSCKFYPNLPIFLHGYIRHIRDILQLWYTSWCTWCSWCARFTSEKQIFLWHVWIWFLYNSMWEEVCRIIYIFDAATILAEHVEFPILFWVHRTLINLMLLPFWQKMLSFQFHSECTEHFSKIATVDLILRIGLFKYFSQFRIEFLRAQSTS